MNSKIYFSLIFGILTQIFFGIPSISTRRPWILTRQKIDADTASSILGKYIVLNDVLLYQNIDTNHTIPCYEKEAYESLIEKFTTNLSKAMSKYGSYLRCRYGTDYIKAEGYLKCIKDIITPYPRKLENWINGKSVATLEPDFTSAGSSISLCDLELTVYLKLITQKADLAAKKFYKLVDDSRKEAKTKSEALMKEISACIYYKLHPNLRKN